jgi:hypothetical protein
MPALPAPSGVPSDRLGGLVASLDRGEAVLEVLDAIEDLGVAIYVEQHASQSSTLGHVERVVAIAQLLELALSRARKSSAATIRGMSLTSR